MIYLLAVAILIAVIEAFIILRMAEGIDVLMRREKELVAALADTLDPGRKVRGGKDE